ncbi:MAG: AMP-binding protein [Anaerolineales bacterium]|nr:AMP-binding protein [Anaerolineales bacterium]
MTSLSFTPEAIESSLAARFEAVALAMPDQIAIVDGEDLLTYAALNRLANKLAHLMLALHGPTSEPVAFLIEHGMKQHVAMLAIAKAGKYYLPLDPNLPVEAMREMLAHAGAPILITTDGYSEIAAALAAGQCEVLNLIRAGRR